MESIDPFDFVRTIAVARIMMPKSYIRLAVRRERMSDKLQALCFLAGINSIFYGERLLTVQNTVPELDNYLFHNLEMQILNI